MSHGCHSGMNLARHELDNFDNTILENDSTILTLYNYLTQCVLNNW